MASLTPVKRKNHAPEEITTSNKKRRVAEVYPDARSKSIDGDQCFLTPSRLQKRSFLSKDDASGNQHNVSPGAANLGRRSLSIDSLPEASRARSRSIDSVPDSLMFSPPPHSSSCLTSFPMSSSKSQSPATKICMDGVLISSGSSLPVPIYHPVRNEVAETQGLEVPGESKTLGKDRPVRNLNHFTLYGHDGTYLPFALVVRSLEKGVQRTILASGVVTRRLADPEDGDSDIECVDTELLVSLQPLVDFWVDYDHDQESTVWIATQDAWYILQEPDILYATFYQPFWVAHYLTWQIARVARQDQKTGLKEFLRQLQDREGGEATLIMGRELIPRDLKNDYTVLYIIDRLSSLDDSKELLITPLLQNLVSQAAERDMHIGDLFDLNAIAQPQVSVHVPMQTVTMPIVHKLTTGIFLTSLLKAGKELNDNERRHELLKPPEPPDILHPDSPTNIEWKKPIDGAPGYFGRVCLDGEPYNIGDVVMVNPGEDEVVHRAKSAIEACSRSGNALLNKVWFCKIVYMHDKCISESDHRTERTAHVQWYQDGAKTILQETAHPYGLFALAECADVPVGAILGRCAVRHLKPGDQEPNTYHCSFLWDADDCRFLDQAVLSGQEAPTDGHPYCPCCAFNQKRENDATHETLIHSNDHATVRGMHYHKDDFVYIAAMPNNPYLIGQIRGFFVDRELRLENTKVELKLFGRYDDVARAVEKVGCLPQVKKDELRLFMTEQVERYGLRLLEGKCFVHTKDSSMFHTVGRVADHFYVDRWAKRLVIRDLTDLKTIRARSIPTCKICAEEASEEQREFQDYMTCHSPLRAMELFAGAGGLSTGLEQSGFVETRWAVEISSGAAATFQANHPGARVYNQDTNICLQSAIDVEAGKTDNPLYGLADEQQLPPMPRRGDVDLIAGGFPCQSFSGLNHQRHKRPDDIRTTLVANMLSYVEFYQPQYVLMENVKGLLQHHIQGGRSQQDGDDIDGERLIKMGIVKFVLRALTCLGYQAQLKVLQAADYGSPQRRERVIFWGTRRSHVLPEYPLPTHVATDYRVHTLNLPTHDKLVPSRRSEEGCAPFRALIVADAISDLPGFDWKKPLKNIAQDIDETRSPQWAQLSAVSSITGPLTGFLGPVDYATLPSTRYQRMMRGDQTQVTLHCSRAFTEPIVARVWHVCGDKVVGPRDIPRLLWTQAMEDASASKLRKIWQQRFSRLKWEEPFSTALTHCHPFMKGSKLLHPNQRRILTARECARSQGFPDYYEFVQGEKDAKPETWARLLDDIHRQIGNAVPVPLARALGDSLGKALVIRWRGIRGRDNHSARSVWSTHSINSHTSFGRPLSKLPL